MLARLSIGRRVTGLILVGLAVLTLGFFFAAAKVAAISNQARQMVLYQVNLLDGVAEAERLRSQQAQALSQGLWLEEKSRREAGFVHIDQNHRVRFADLAQKLATQIAKIDGQLNDAISATSGLKGASNGSSDNYRAARALLAQYAQHKKVLEDFVRSSLWNSTGGLGDAPGSVVEEQLRLLDNDIDESVTALRSRIQVGSTQALGQIEAMQSSLGWSLGLVGLAWLLLVGGGGVLVVHGIGSPLRQLIQLAARITNDDSLRKEPVGNELVFVSKAMRQVAEVVDRARISLVQSEMQHRILAYATDAAPVVMAYVNENGRWEFANQQFERWFGLNRKKLIGRDAMEVLTAISASTSSETIRRNLQRVMIGERQSFYAVFRREDGANRHGHITFMPMSEGGMPKGFFALLADVTELKQAEYQVRSRDVDLQARVEELTFAKRELERVRDELAGANQAKTMFLAAMSHEIRTPINGVIGMLEMLGQGHLDKQQEEMVRVALDSGQALLSLLNDVLDFSKIESGKLDLEQIDFAPLDLIEGVADLMGANAEAKDLRLVTHVDGTVPPRILGDPTRTRQIVTNLVSNAIKFTERGRVVIRATILHREDEPAAVYFAVSDTGIGLDGDAQSRLFQAFTQADRSTTRRFGGTGLGLSICKSLAALMGGEIGVTSEVGQGSTFWFTVPLRPLDPAVDVGSLPDLTGLRVGVIDEDLTAAEITREYIERTGAKVLIGRDARELVDATSGRESKAAFSVICVSGGFGPAELVRAAKECHAIPDLAEAKLIGIAGRNSLRHPQALAEARFSEVLARPLRAHGLVATLASTCGREIPDSFRAARPKQRQFTSGHFKAAGDALILVADDTDTNRRLLEMQLERLGFKVVLAHDGREAFDRYRREKVSLVLTDFHMPEMDGLELAEAIRSAERMEGRTRVPILVVSADVVEESVRKFKAAGADDYLTKPIALSELAERLGFWLGLELEEDAPTDVSAPAATSPAEVAEDRKPAVDISILRKNFSDDLDMVRDLVSIVQNNIEELLEQIGSAILAHDLAALGDKAHTLKGTSRSIALMPIGMVAGEMEKAARNGDDDWAAHAETLAGLKDLYEMAIPALESLGGARQWSDLT